MIDSKRIFKNGVMQSLTISEMHRGNYGSALYALCVRYDKSIVKAYPTMDGNGPRFIVKVRNDNGELKKFSYPYYQFKKACGIIKQIALMARGKGCTKGTRSEISNEDTDEILQFI